LRQALEDGDGEALGREAHTLKGSGLNLGAARLAQLCQRLEDLGKAASFEEVPALVSAVEAEFEQVCVALERYVREELDKGTAG